MITKDPAAVAVEVQAIGLAMYPKGDPQFIPQVFRWVTDCFTGRHRDYQAIDAAYHDFEHTLQATLCMARLLQGRHRAGAAPVLTDRMFQLGLLAILLHDTGYLKKRGDLEGTGAKYTIEHVDRSAAFAEQLLAEKGFEGREIRAVQNMIHCTGLDAKLNAIPFQSEAEQTTGFALGTADLLGQMAADDYVDRLPALYAEFAESARHHCGSTHFTARYGSVEDLMRKTPEFWESFVRRKLEREFQGLFRFLNQPYPGGPNFYIERIEANMVRLRRMLALA